MRWVREFSAVKRLVDAFGREGWVGERVRGKGGRAVGAGGDRGG